MKLIYTYISNYRSIKNINFNLGGKYRFKYDSESRDFTFEVNDFYIPDFFEVAPTDDLCYAKVRQVSAIVGENGVGKTTFLDFIKENFIEGANGFTTESIVVMESYDDDTFIIYFPSSLLLTQESRNRIKQKKGFILREFGPRAVIPDKSLQGLFNIRENPVLDETTKISYVYFSNLFDKRWETEFVGLYNISTNYLIKKDFKNQDEESKDQIVSLEDHRQKELQREIAFINAFKSNYSQFVKFKLPDRLAMSIVPGPPLMDADGFIQQEVLYFLNSYKIHVGKKQFSNYERYINNLFYRGLYSILVEIYNNHPIGPYRDFTKKELDIQNFLTENEPIDTLILDFFIERTKEHAYLNSKFISLKKMLTLLTIYVRQVDNKVDADDNIFIFDLGTKELEARFFEFYSLYREAYTFKSYLTFEWSDLSTGQKAMLSIYSRLYSLSDSELYPQYANLILNRDIVLLIDEGELYLHPSWQKEILNQLLIILPLIFKVEKKGAGSYNRNIQIILTTNSPFPITDIPSANIVFLKKEKLEDGTEKVVSQDSLNDQKHTFAANIHTLLSDSFFMKNGFIGDFAKTKINQIITDLNNAKILQKQRRDEIRIIIQMVGEPVLKNKLLQLYDAKYNVNIHERLDRIEKQLGLDD